MIYRINIFVFSQLLPLCVESKQCGGGVSRRAAELRRDIKLIAAELLHDHEQQVENVP